MTLLCCYCVQKNSDEGGAPVAEAVTLVSGNAVCADHISGTEPRLSYIFNTYRAAE